MTKTKRNTKYVDSDLQGNLTLRLTGYWVVYNVALLLTLGGNRLVAFIPDLFSGQTNVDSAQMWTELVADMKPLMLAMAVFCPLMIWDMIRYSHRVAGPLYRFKKAMRGHIGGQKLEPVRLRDGDLLMDFQDTYNEFVQHIRNQQGLEVARQAAEGESSSTPPTVPVRQA